MAGKRPASSLTAMRSHRNYRPNVVALACGRVASARQETGLSREAFADALWPILGHRPTPDLISVWETTIAPPSDVLVACEILASNLAACEEAETNAAEEVRETSQELVALESRLGGDAMLPASIKAFRAAQATLKTAIPPQGRRDLEAATGEAGEVAAWIAYDSGDPGQSYGLARDALIHTRTAGDRSMELFLLNHLTMLDIVTGAPGERTIRTTDQVFDDKHLSPRVEAIFRIRRGRALARLGDSDGAIKEIQQAKHVIANGVVSGDPYWTWWADEAEVTWHEGMALGELGEWRRAVPLFERTVTLRDDKLVRSLYNDKVHLLSAYTHAGAWNDAGSILGEITGAGQMVTSGRTTRLLREATASIISAGSAVPPDVADAAHAVEVGASE